MILFMSGMFASGLDLVKNMIIIFASGLMICACIQTRIVISLFIVVEKGCVALACCFGFINIRVFINILGRSNSLNY